MKQIFKIFATGIAVLLFFILAAFLYVNDQIKGPGGNEILVEIPPGSAGVDIAAILEQKKVIKNSYLFRLALRINSNSRISAGSFRLDPSKNVFDIANSLKADSIEITLTTIPEGLTLEQTAETLSDQGLCQADDFIKTANVNKYYINEKELKSVEGYLFPETYNFPESSDSDIIIKTMLSEFERRFFPLYRQYRDDMPVSMSLDEVVILASLVEREAQVPEERPIIAGVYFNRLKKKMKLECDATVMYALKEKKEILLYSDLEIDSPYNTYKYPGLPPGAIASPGIDSLKSVIKPANHEFYYYVRNDVLNDGSHIFTKNFEQHQAAIEKYQK